MFDQVHEDLLAGREYGRAAGERSRGGRRVRDRVDGFAAFADEVMGWHRPVVRDGEVPMCSCGEWGRRCRYLRAGRDYLGTALPWEPAAGRRS